MRFTAFALTGIATITGISTAALANEEHPVFSHMMILEVDQFYNGNLNERVFTNTL